MQRSKQTIFLLLITVMMLISCDQMGAPRHNIRLSQDQNKVAAANLDLGIAYLKQKNYKSALKNLERAREAAPDYPAIYNVFGLLYQQIGDTKKAEQNFKYALRLDSNNSSTLNNYGNFLCQQERLEEAEKTFLKAAGNPLYASPEIAMTNAGLCLYNNQKKLEAKNHFQKALQINPRIPQALIKMCELTLDDFNYLSARGYIQRYQQISRHSARSPLAVGIQIERELGDKDAVSSYSLLLRNSFPDSNEAAILRKSKIQ